MIAWVYILTNKPHGVLYVGVTSDMKGRMAKHKSKFYPNSFTARYNTDRLVYYERIDGMMNAIRREKQIKAGNRARKVKYIETMNPEWKDLTPELGG
jgi:putative endonuclease